MFRVSSLRKIAISAEWDASYCRSFSLFLGGTSAASSCLTVGLMLCCCRPKPQARAHAQAIQTAPTGRQRPSTSHAHTHAHPADSHAAQSPSMPSDGAPLSRQGSLEQLETAQPRQPQVHSPADSSGRRSVSPEPVIAPMSGERFLSSADLKQLDSLRDEHRKMLQADVDRVSIF